MQTLEKERGNGRNEYPIRPAWERGYGRRTAVERVNSRIDRGLSYNTPFEVLRRWKRK